MDKIAVLDFGSQYTHLLARRVRQLNVFSEILPADTKAEKLREFNGIILSGGPASVYSGSSPKPDKRLFDIGVPILGLCYGHQLMAHLLGGKVEKGKVREYGSSQLKIEDKTDIFSGLGDEEKAWMSHFDQVAKLPNGFKKTASTRDCEIAAMSNNSKKLYSTQFHPEVAHTPNGMKMLRNFVFGVCKCRAEWTIKDYAEQVIKEIKSKAGKNNVFLLVSGGVDSTVCFALLEKALGTKRVYGLHIDNGFVRKNESMMVKKTLEKQGYKNLHVVDASRTFYERLKGVIDPEEKRRIIGNTFLDVFNDNVKKLNLDPEKWILAQGTIYPDTIETGGTQHSDRIKTHHNRVEIMRKLIEDGKVIEPLVQLYKDEVRELGEELGLPHRLVWRHPFPGPGLAIRALCAEKESYPENKKEVERAINNIVSKYSLKAFVLPVKSVGVQGDERSYRNPVALAGKTDYNTLAKLSTKITNSFGEISRVVWLVNPKTISSIGIVKKDLNKERMELLREADQVTMDALDKHDLMDKIWQCPTILIPVSINNKGESVVIRPVYSKEAMTAEFGRIDFDVVHEIAEKLCRIKGIGAVFYDVTHKPPGTIEWE